ncbi:MAG: N-methyl-transferase-related protein, partial [uncultured Thermomicrobiales bacterium]
MEWVERFYARQHEWLGVYYLGGVVEQHRDQAARIARLAGPGPKRVLELGAGGGQGAAAAADLGHDVTAIELLPAAAAHAEALSAQPRSGTLTVVPGDFYKVHMNGPFDVACYWDGFGIGTDVDQRRLLSRVHDWLAPEGCALIEVITPWYWSRVTGQEMRFEKAMRRYDFDAEGCRMLDRWWPLDDEGQAVVQSLRCYSPVDLRLLLEGTGLTLQSLEPGGAVDYETRNYSKQVPLGQAMSYVAKLV